MSMRSKRIERRLKRTIFGALAGRQVTSVEPTNIDLSAIRKILFVRANFRMGNLLLVTPALAAARRALPDARLDVLSAGPHDVLLNHHPAVDEVLLFTRAMLIRPRGLTGLIWKIRRERYDLVVDCARGGSFFGAVLCGMSGGRYRVAATGSRYRAFFNVHVTRAPDVDHKVDLLPSVLAAIGIPPVTREMGVVLTEEERERARIRWERLGLPDEAAVVGIIVGGRDAKRITRNDLLELVAQLQARGSRVALLIGPEEQEIASELREAMPDGATVVDPLPVREFAALLARFTVVVSADTGPMHLAVAVGVPTVAILKSTASWLYRPVGDRHRALYDERGVRPARIAATVERLLATASLRRREPVRRNGADQPLAYARVALAHR
jgi:heptosyltransferase III